MKENPAIAKLTQDLRVSHGINKQNKCKDNNGKKT